MKSIKRPRQVFLSFLVLPFCAYAGTAMLSDFKLTQASSHCTEAVFTLNKPTAYHVLHLHSPERIAIDFSDTRNMSKKPDWQRLNSVINNIRFGQPTPHVLRIVFDVNTDVSPQTSTFMQAHSQEERIFLNLCTKSFVPTPPRVANSVPVMQANTFSKTHPMVVVIDAGHGGKDPGAIGIGGVQEKNVVLAIAKQLYENINAKPGMRAVLTRKGDYYLELRQRLAIARENQADIFIAVHADAFQNGYSHGASVYAVSLRGASSEAARWLAEKENYSELAGVSLNDKNDMLRGVLLDLSQTATMSASGLLGDEILQNLSTFSKLHYRHVERAAFVVLKSPDIPSVLIETGFISNRDDEKNLNKTGYQQKLADAISSGIVDYFARNVS